MGLSFSFPLRPKWSEAKPLIQAHALSGPGDAANPEYSRGPGAYWVFNAQHVVTSITDALTLRAFFHGLYGSTMPFLLRMPFATGTTPPGNSCALRTDGCSEHTDCTDFTDGTAYADYVASSVPGQGATTALAVKGAATIAVDSGIDTALLVVGNYMMLGDAQDGGQLVQIVAVSGSNVDIRPRLRADLPSGSVITCGPVLGRFVLEGDPPDIALRGDRGAAFQLSVREDY